MAQDGTDGREHQVTKLGGSTRFSAPMHTTDDLRAMVNANRNQIRSVFMDVRNQVATHGDTIVRVGIARRWPIANRVKSDALCPPPRSARNRLTIWMDSSISSRRSPAHATHWPGLRCEGQRVNDLWRSRPRVEFGAADTCEKSESDRAVLGQCLCSGWIPQSRATDELAGEACRPTHRRIATRTIVARSSSVRRSSALASRPSAQMWGSRG